MIEVILGFFWIFVLFYSPIAVLIGIPMVISSYFETVYSDPEVRPDMVDAILHDVKYYFLRNWSKNKDYRNSFLIGVFLLITGGLGFYVLIKGYIQTPW